MIAEELRQAIRLLKGQGQPLREISRLLKVSRNTVRRVLRKPERPEAPAEDPRLQAIVELLPELYRDCKGNAVRIGEILKDTHRIEIAYSTLTRLIREHTDLRTPKKRSGTYTFGPGEEMQHDTSPHQLLLGGKKVKAQCASMILAYSRLLFFQYYPRFTRFEAKAFLSAALQFFDGAARRCVIDNTSVILAGGSGANALIAPEMEAFAELFGFEFMACLPSGIRIARDASSGPFPVYREQFPCRAYLRRLGGPQRPGLHLVPAGCQRQAQTHSGYESTSGLCHGKGALACIAGLYPPGHRNPLPGSGLLRLRAPADTNRYSVPERWVGKKVAVHKRPEQVLVYADRKLLAEHPRLIGQHQGEQRAESHHTQLERRRAIGPSPQEQALTGQDPRLDDYVVALKKRAPARGVGKLRRLLELQRTYPVEPFLAAIEQALHYGLFDLARLERLILERVAGDFFDLEEDT